MQNNPVSVKSILLFILIPLSMAIIYQLFGNQKYYTYTKTYYSEIHEKQKYIDNVMTINLFEDLLNKNKGTDYRDTIRMESGSFCSNNFCKFIKLFVRSDRYIFFDNKNTSNGSNIFFYFKNKQELNDMILIEKNLFEDYFTSFISSCISNLKIDAKKKNLTYTEEFIDQRCILPGQYKVLNSNIGSTYRISPFVNILISYLAFLLILINLYIFINDFREKN